MRKIICELQAFVTVIVAFRYLPVLCDVFHSYKIICLTSMHYKVLLVEMC